MKKALIVAKSAVVVFSLFILIGFTLVVLKITENRTKIKVQNRGENVLFLEEDEKPIQMIPCGDDICTLSFSLKKGYRLLVINIQKGYILKSVALSHPRRDISKDK